MITRVYSEPIRSVYPAGHMPLWGNATTGNLLDASGEYQMAIVRVWAPGWYSGPKRIAKVWWRIGTTYTWVASSVFRVALQDVDLTGVLANGTGGDDQVCDHTTDFGSTLATITSTLDAVRSVEAFEYVCVKWYWQTHQTGAAIRIHARNPSVGSNSYFTAYHGLFDVGGGHSKSCVYPYLMFEFDDGTFGWPWNIDRQGPPVSGTGPSGEGWNSGSSPSERGGRIAMPFAAEVVGVGGGFYSTAGAANVTMTVRVYEDEVLIRTLTVNTSKDFIDCNGFERNHIWMLDDPFVTKPGSNYDVTLEPDTVDNAGFVQWTVASADHISGLMTDMPHVTRSGGATTVTETKRVPVCLVLGGIGGG